MYPEIIINQKLTTITNITENGANESEIIMNEMRDEMVTNLKIKHDCVELSTFHAQLDLNGFTEPSQR